MRRTWSSRLLLPLSLAGILLLGGVSGGLHVIAGMVLGTAVGVVLVLGYRLLKRR